MYEGLFCPYKCSCSPCLNAMRHWDFICVACGGTLSCFGPLGLFIRKGRCFHSVGFVVQHAKSERLSIHWLLLQGEWIICLWIYQGWLAFIAPLVMVSRFVLAVSAPILLRVCWSYWDAWGRSYKTYGESTLPVTEKLGHLIYWFWGSNQKKVLFMVVQYIFQMNFV